MKLKADIKHGISTSNTYSTELEVQWQNLPQLPTALKLLTFDMQGYHAATYGNDRIIKVSDARTILVPITLLSVPPTLFDSKGDFNCTQLCFSNCSTYLLGSFALRTKKRKLQVDCVSMLVLWHIPSQSIVSRLSLPMAINVLQVAPSACIDNPCFFATSSTSTCMILIDFGSGEVYSLFPCDDSSKSRTDGDSDNHVMDQTSLQFVVRISSIDICSTVTGDTLETDKLPPITVISLPPSLQAQPPMDSITHGFLKRFDDSNAMWLKKLVVIWAVYSDQQGISWLSSLEISRTSCSSSNSSSSSSLSSTSAATAISQLFIDRVVINTIKLSGTKPIAMCGNCFEDKVLLSMTDRVLLFDYAVRHDNHDYDDGSNLNTSITAGDDSSSLAHTPNKNLWVTSITISPSTSLSPLHPCGEFYGFPRHTKLSAINFLSMHFTDEKHTQTTQTKTHYPDLHTSREILVLNTMQQVDRLQPHATMIIWDFLHQPKVTNNKLQTSLSSSISHSLYVIPLCCSLLPMEVIVQPLRWSQKRVLTANTPQSLYAIDADHHLWVCNNFFFNTFPGPMFPPGYTLIEQVRLYKELEDELDIVMVEDKSAENNAELQSCISSSPLDISDDTTALEKFQQLPRLPLAFQQLVLKVQEKRNLTTAALNRKTLRRKALPLQPLMPMSMSMPVQTQENKEEGEGEEGDFEEDADDIDREEEDFLESSSSSSYSSSMNKRELFPSTLFSFLTVPSRIKTGDFATKLGRERAVGESIRQSIFEKSLIQERIHDLMMESITLEVKATVSKEKARLKSIEKKIIRETKRQDILRDIFSMAIQKTEVEGQSVRDEIRVALDGLISKIESGSESLPTLLTFPNMPIAVVPTIEINVDNSATTEAAAAALIMLSA